MRCCSSRRDGRGVARHLTAVVLLAATLVGCGADRGSLRLVPTSSDPCGLRYRAGPGHLPPATSPIGVPANPESGWGLQVRSVSTGKLLRDLGVQPWAMSLSADGSTVYDEATGGPLDPFPIERIFTSGGPPVAVASGEDPAISSDGSSLAYATGDGHAVAIDEVVRHSTRRVELGPLIGSGASFTNTPGTLTWLGDSRLVAILHPTPRSPPQHRPPHPRRRPTPPRAPPPTSGDSTASSSSTPTPRHPPTSSSSRPPGPCPSSLLEPARPPARS